MNKYLKDLESLIPNIKYDKITEKYHRINLNADSWILFEHKSAVDNTKKIKNAIVNIFLAEDGQLMADVLTLEKAIKLIKLKNFK